jgi:UDP-glucose 4-epimerase
MKPLILLTGAGGYLGKNLATSFLGEFNLREHFKSKTVFNEKKNMATFGDLHESRITKSIVNGIECVVHAAALIPSNRSKPSAQEYVENNLEVTINLARAALNANVERFVYISTVNLYDHTNTNANESSLTGNFMLYSDYLQSKLDAENELTEIFRNREDDLLILRIGTPFGGEEPKDKLIPSMINRALLNEDLVLTASGSTNLNYIYMPDLIKSISFLLKSKQSGIFNISSSFNLESLVRTIITSSGSSSNLLNNFSISDQANYGFPLVSSRKLQELARLEFMSLTDSISDYVSRLSKE